MNVKQKIRMVLDEYYAKGFTTTQPFPIGRVELRMKQYASENNITLGSKSLYFTPKSIAHPNRKSKKAKGLTISQMDFEDFPSNRNKMDLFWDHDGFIYTDYRVKFIIKPNYEIKMKLKNKGRKHQIVRRVCLVTAGVVSSKYDFTDPRYKKI